MGTAQAKRTIVRIDCDGCDDVEVTTQLGHAEDTPQTQAVVDAHEIIVNEHCEETDHNVELTVQEKDAN